MVRLANVGCVDTLDKLLAAVRLTFRETNVDRQGGRDRRIDAAYP